MTMRLASHVLHEGMIVFVDGDQVFLPLSEIVQGLGLPINVRFEEAYAEGWFREENNRFVLDIEKQRLIIAGKAEDTDWSLVEWHEFEIYVESELLKDWFDLQFEVLLNSLLIRVEQGQWLPLEQKLTRHKQWESLGQQVAITTSQQPEQVNPPHLIGWPTLDNNLRVGVRGRSGSLEPQYQYDLLAGGELLWLNAMYSLNLGRTGVSNFDFTGRLQLDNRISEETDWRISLGDFTAPAIALVNQQQDGVGFLISSFPQQQSAEFDRIGLNGDALNGWDVEVYQNNQLVAFQTVDESNRYEFNELPVQFGLNLFRLMLYGPEGQRRERTEQFIIGDDMVPEGHSQWQFSTVLGNRRLLPGQEQFVFADVDGQELLDSLQTNLAWRYGLNASWSLNAGLSRLPDSAERQTFYGNFGVQASHAGVLYQLEQSTTSRGGRAARLSAQFLSAGSNWFGEYAQFRDYDSPLQSSSTSSSSLQQRAQVSWSSRLGQRDPISAQSRYEQYQDGRRRLRNEFRYSHRYSDLNLSVGLNHELDNVRRDRISGGSLLSYRADRWELNSQLSYQLKPSGQLQSANFTGAWRPNEKFNLRTNFRKAFSASAEDSLSLNLSTSTNRCVISVATNYDFMSDFGINVNFFSSLSRENTNWHAYARSRSNTATLSARVFLDNNHNDAFDGDDEALPGVRFRLAGGGNFMTTDAEGIAVLSGLSTQAPLYISLNEKSLEDPYWLPTKSNYKIHLRPGQSRELLFPITQSAEVDGTVWILLDGKEKPASNVQVQLVSNEGRVIKETKTAFDGFYLLDRVVPGKYHLRLVEKQLERLRLRVEEEFSVNLSGNGDVQSGLDFHLLPTDEAS